MSKPIETIVIPSAGTLEEDLVRFKRGIEYAGTLKYKEVHYLISGIGPHLNERLHMPDNHTDKTKNYKINEEGKVVGRDFRIGEQEKISETFGLDVHPELWSKAVWEVERHYQETGEWKPFGVDTVSIDSVGNILNSFSKEQGGEYTIVSRNRHNSRLRMIEKWARKKGMLSSELKLKYLSTGEKSSIKNTVYDTLALGKEIKRQIIDYFNRR